LIRDGIYLKELRKKIVSESLYYTDKLLEEIGKRIGFTIKQVRFLDSDDIEKRLLGNVHTTDIDKRIKLSAFVIEKGKTKILEGVEAEKIKKEVMKIDSSLKEIKGMAVSPGKIRGPAKIVFDPKDISKVKQGDIMVTVQAVPSFSSAIKIAGALLADGGTGITSHPATLAREAGIPCVTGLKVATDIIKDGDMIEVDGNIGVVRLI
jgi:phosphoenolpyruvate synthase/pyruvate phosphate dikinase